MPRRNLPPFVQVLRAGDRIRGYRGWAIIGGKRRFGPTRRDALAAHRDAMTLRRGQQDAATWRAGTMESRTDEWLTTIEATDDTVDFYRSKLNNVWPSIARGFPVNRVTPNVLRQLVLDLHGQRGLSGRSIQHVRRALHAFFAWCLRRGIVDGNPVDGLDWPRATETQPTVLTELELAANLAAISDPWAHDLAVAMAYTGLRRAEFARLRREDVDLESGVLWVRGKSRDQSQPIDPAAIDAMRSLLIGRIEFVVPGSTDRARRSRISETFRKWQRRLCDRRWRPHVLRHTVATILLRKGAGGPAVQRFLRHSSYAMTQKYVHMVEDDVRKATARLKLVGDEASEQHG